MTITNETIIKATKAAGLTDVREEHGCIVRGFRGSFYPQTDDTDNAMIRRGAEIDVVWWKEYPDRLAEVQATAWIEKADCDLSDIDVVRPHNNDKAQAEREAVILCAAAKFDAMQGEKV